VALNGDVARAAPLLSRLGLTNAGRCMASASTVAMACGVFTPPDS
jgi:hypothetical protein